jgi:DNA repair exonuclease SbcCD ATPase subunit
MHIKRVQLRNVMSHVDTTVDFPDRGIVLVTGANGSGKSSLIEAVSVGVWDESLRRKPVWSGDRGELHVVGAVGATSVTVDRVKTKTRTTLSFTENDTPATVYETRTKAQAALERIVGTHALWRKTHVFSSHDAGHFTLATDGDRKKLLEDLLGLGKFDDAHNRARVEHRAAEQRVLNSQLATVLALGARDVARARLQDARARVAEEDVMSPVDPTAYGAAVANLQRLKAATKEVEEAEWAAQRRAAELGAALAAHKARATRLDALGDVCPTCEQSVSPAHAQGLCGPAPVSQRDYDAATRAEASARTARTQHNDALRAAHALVAKLDAQTVAATRAAAARARAEETTLKLLGALEDASDALDAARAVEADARASAGTLGAAVQVLSLTGVRSYLLGTALSGIESVANSWLNRLAGEGLALRLSPYTDKAAGGIRDAIQMTVDGAGGGHGYLGASGGERRRIDIAVMLALADVAEAAAGTRGGTLFFDEVFDALDADGVDAACNLLGGLAEDRCVVVITHNEDLQERLSVTRRLHVSEGEIK